MTNLFVGAMFPIAGLALRVLPPSVLSRYAPSLSPIARRPETRINLVRKYRFGGLFLLSIGCLHLVEALVVRTKLCRQDLVCPLLAQWFSM